MSPTETIQKFLDDLEELDRRAASDIMLSRHLIPVFRTALPKAGGALAVALECLHVIVRTGTHEDVNDPFKMSARTEISEFAFRKLEEIAAILTPIQEGKK